MSSSEEEIVPTCLLTEEEQNERKRRRFWVRNICKEIMAYCEFDLLHPDLLGEATFFEDFRMTYRKFLFTLVDLLGPNLSSESTISILMSHQ